MRARGKMLWFNETKDMGALRTDEGERIEFPGTAFMPGEKPVDRCIGKVVEFDEQAGQVDRIAFISEPERGRARRRRR